MYEAADGLETDEHCLLPALEAALTHLIGQPFAEGGGGAVACYEEMVGRCDEVRSCRGPSSATATWCLGGGFGKRFVDVSQVLCGQVEGRLGLKGELSGDL